MILSRAFHEKEKGKRKNDSEAPSEYKRLESISDDEQKNQPCKKAGALTQLSVVPKDGQVHRN